MNVTGSPSWKLESNFKADILSSYLDIRSTEFILKDRTEFKSEQSSNQDRVQIRTEFILKDRTESHINLIHLHYIMLLLFIWLFILFVYIIHI